MTVNVKLKRVRISPRKDPLTDPSKLSAIGRRASLKAQQRAFDNGVSVTVVKNGAVVRVGPDGVTEEIKKSNLLFLDLKKTYASVKAYCWA